MSTNICQSINSSKLNIMASSHLQKLNCKSNTLMLAEYDRIRNIHKWENKVKRKASHKLVSSKAISLFIINKTQLMMRILIKFTQNSVSFSPRQPFEQGTSVINE